MQRLVLDGIGQSDTLGPHAGQFLEKDFKPYVEAHFAAKPKTAEYYAYGTALLLEAEMGDLLLNEISSQHAAGYIAKQSKRSPSTINCGLRTLRRALNLADEWGKIDRAPKLRSRQRRTAAGEGSHSSGISCLSGTVSPAVARCGNGALWHRDAPRRGVQTPLGAHSPEWPGGLIQIAEGKTKAARRFLPMVPAVYARSI